MTIPSTTEAPGRIIATPTDCRSTFTRAAFSAEANGDRIARNKPFMCGRGKSRSPITPEECLASFRAGEKPCVSEAHGRCSVGIIQDTKFPEDTMGKTNYGKCVECGRKGNRDSAGRCYHAACKAQRGKPKPGRAQPFEKIEELPARQVEPETAGASPEAEGCRSAEEAQADRTFQASRALIASGAAMISPEEREHLVGQPAELPEDLDRPFVLDGIEFEPLPPKEPAIPPYFSIRNKDLVAFNVSAVKRFNLSSYTHARFVLGKDGQTIGVKFYTRAREGALHVQIRRSREAVVSSRDFVRLVGKLLHRRAVLESTARDGFFVARFGGEGAA